MTWSRNAIAVRRQVHPLSKTSLETHFRISPLALLSCSNVKASSAPTRLIPCARSVPLNLTLHLIALYVHILGTLTAAGHCQVSLFLTLYYSPHTGQSPERSKTSSHNVHPRPLPKQGRDLLFTRLLLLLFTSSNSIQPFDRLHHNKRCPRHL